MWDVREKVSPAPQDSLGLSSWREETSGPRDGCSGSRLASAQDLQACPGHGHGHGEGGLQTQGG